jgi:hypothetical protein
VKGDFVDIHSWRSVLQFEAIKDALAVGIQEHLKYNNVVRWILDMGDATEERIVDRVRLKMTEYSTDYTNIPSISIASHF